MLRGFDQPRQHGVWVYLEYTSDRSNAQAFGQGGHDAYDELGWHVLTMQRSAEGLLEILVAREALELAHGPPPGWPLVRMLPHPPNHSRHTFPQGNNAAAYPHCAGGHAWSRSTAVRHQVAAWAWLSAHSRYQVGLMMRPGNGFGSAERLVEGLAGRRSVDSIATGRRSHSQEQSTPRHRSPSRRRGHKILGVYHLIPFHIHQVNGGILPRSSLVQATELSVCKRYDPALVPAA